MQTSITKEWLEELMGKSDIVSVISRYVDLSKRGTQFWGRCPFHNEKTPSFAVNSRGQFFKCFGCGAGGDVISFIRKRENLEFVEAVKLLAEQAHMEVPSEPQQAERSREAKRVRDAILSVNKHAALFYHRSLYSDEGGHALKYLHGRGIDDELIKSFGIGYSPRFGTVKYLLDKGVTFEDIALSGIAFRRGADIVESFSERVMIPIIDMMRNVIAFGGRALGDIGAKYKNSNNNAVFDKSKSLFGINLVKQLPEHSLTNIIVTEGYMDVISMHKAGFCNCVASMGTSLTKEQAKLLKRFTQNVILCYDGDSAGTSGTLRGLDILTDEGLTVRVVSLPDRLDPDDVIKTRGKGAMQDCLDRALPLMQYKLTKLRESYDMSKTDSRSQYGVRAVDLIRTLKSEVERNEYLTFLSKSAGFPLHVLTKQLENGAVAGDVKNVIYKPVVNTPCEHAALYILRACAANYIQISDYILIEDYLTTETQKLAFSYLVEGIPVNHLFHTVEEDKSPELLDIISVGLSGDEEQIISDAKSFYKQIERAKIEAELAAIISRIELTADKDIRAELYKSYDELSKKLKI